MFIEGGKAVKCVKCGNEIPDDSKFCPSCGQAISGSNEFNAARDAVSGKYDLVREVGLGEFLRFIFVNNKVSKIDKGFLCN